MRIRCQLILVAVCALFMQSSTLGIDPTTEATSEIQSDPDMQAQLEGAFEEYAAYHKAFEAGIGYGEFHARIAVLQKLAEKDLKKLVLQLVYNVSTAKMDKSMVWLLVAGECLGIEYRVRPHKVLDVLAPYLGTKDRRLKESIYVLMYPIDHNPHTEQWDFTEYKRYLQSLVQQKIEPPKTLIDYMYQNDPEQALLVFLYAYGAKDETSRKEILWAEHTISDVLWKQKHGFLGRNEVPLEAVKILENLRKRDEWWTRKYVEEVQQKRRSFKNAMEKNAAAAGPN